MTKAKILAVLGLLALTGTVVYRSWSPQDEVFSYAGTIEATKIDVPARLASVIARLAVQEGSKVERGQVLVDLACEDLRLQDAIIRKNFQRGQSLLVAGSMPREAFDQLQSQYNASQLKLDWCSIEAPINGTVLTQYYEAGEWVAPGSKLLTLADLDEVWTSVYVPQPMLARLQIGMNVKAYLPELGMHKLEGVLVKINEEAEFTPKNVQTRDERTRLVYGIKLRFKNSQNLLKPGMPIEITLPDAAP